MSGIENCSLNYSMYKLIHSSSISQCIFCKIKGRGTESVWIYHSDLFIRGESPESHLIRLGVAKFIYLLFTNYSSSKKSSLLSDEKDDWVDTLSLDTVNFFGPCSERNLWFMSSSRLILLLGSFSSIHYRKSFSSSEISLESKLS